MATFRIDPEFRGILKPLTPSQHKALKLSIETDGIAEGSFWVANVNGDHILIDGHNRYDICKALRLTLPKPKIIKLADRQSCMDWIIQHAGTARDVSPEYLEGLREERNRHILEQRREGASTRTIAEAEQVSQKTVVRVLANAPEPSGESIDSPETESQKIQGIDGKTYSAPKPIFCDRCARTGPVKDCPKCQLVRRKKRGDGRSKKPRGRNKESTNGTPVFNLQTARMYIGKFTLEADKISRWPGQKNNPLRAALQRLTDEAQNVLEKWLKEASKGQST